MQSRGEMVKDNQMPGLSVNRSLDSATGQVATTYVWRGQPAVQVEIGGKLAERYSGLALIEKDLQNALRWCKRAETGLIKAGGERASGPRDDSGLIYVASGERELFDSVKAVFVAALTFYAKAFTQAEGRKVQMQRDWLDESFREQHDNCMRF